MKLALDHVNGKCVIVLSQCYKPEKKKQRLNRGKVWKYKKIQERLEKGAFHWGYLPLIPVTKHLVTEGGRLYLGSQFRRMQSIWWGRHTNRSSQVHGSNKEHKSRNETPALRNFLLFPFSFSLGPQPIRFIHIQDLSKAPYLETSSQAHPQVTPLMP